MADVMVARSVDPLSPPAKKVEKKAEEYRNFDDSKRQDIVAKTYRLHHSSQNYDFVQRMKKQHLAFNKGRMTIWEAMQKLDTLVDESDPDVEFPQIFHNFQTAEDLRSQFPDLDWMHLVGLLHDLGKIMALPEYGGLPQWAVVGDTYPVGCQFSKKIVCAEFLEQNPDSKDARYNTKYGIYQPNCGLDNVEITWGHDEYMYQVCVHNRCTIPKEGLDMIRYHSFYPWHREGEYQHLMSKEDHEMLRWVQKFNNADLYSKREELPDVVALKPYYQSLVQKYFPNQVLEW